MNVIVLVLLAVSTHAISTKPECKAANQGRFWPEAANADAAAARRFFRCGELEMCSAHGRHFRWTRLSLNAGQAGTNHSSSTACTAE